MRISIFGGGTTDGTVDDIVGAARQAEQDGFASYWVPQIFGHDALTMLAVVGREVPRIELGTSVVPTYPRHPMMLASQALSVQAASGGRLCLGIGLSHQIVIEGMLGMSFDKPVLHMREYLSILMPLLQGAPVNFKGTTLTFNGAVNVPGSSPCPVVLAALGPKMLQLAGTVADGTLTWCTGPATLGSYIVPTITAAAEQAGRAGVRVIAALPVCVTDDRDVAHQRAASVFAIYGQLPSYRAMMDREGVAGPADLAIVGSRSEVVDRIGGLADIGVTDFAAVEFGATADEITATRDALRQLV
jgi:F420-dependent oxidoreductase-like protein